MGIMFLMKIDTLFNVMSNVFGIANDILFGGNDEQGRDHYATLYKILRICRQANLKHNKDKCHFRGTTIPSFGEIFSWKGVSLKARKI